MISLTNHLWQSTLFALASAMLALALRNTSAATRYRIWLVASLKFLVPFSLLVSIGSEIHVNAPAAQPALQQISTVLIPTAQIEFAQTTEAQIPWPAIMCAIWFCGCALVMARWIKDWLRFKAIVRSASHLPWNTPIPSLATNQLLEPGVFGIIHPVLILPEGITNQLEPAHIEAILAHELCHVRRRDNLFAAIHMLVEALFWFHPLVWWIGNRLIKEREQACDEEVVRKGSQPAIYAESILKVCQFYLESPIPCISGVSGSDLKQRVKRIMTQHFALNLSLSQRFLIFAFATTAVALPLSVGLTQNEPQPTFEVASVKPMRSTGDVIDFRLNHGGIIIKNMTLADVICNTNIYPGIRETDQLMNAPKWIFSERFAIEARPPDAEDSNVHLSDRIKNLLQDRFQLKAHMQSHPVKGYALTIAKQGATFLNSRLPDGQPNCANKAMLPGHLAGACISMPYLTNWISKALGQPVANNTGLGGFYTIDLTYDAPGEQETGPSLFRAVQRQLGLQLIPETQTGALLVIDHVEHPSAN